MTVKLEPEGSSARLSDKFRCKHVALPLILRTICRGTRVLKLHTICAEKHRINFGGERFDPARKGHSALHTSGSPRLSARQFPPPEADRCAPAPHPARLDVDLRDLTRFADQAVRSGTTVHPDATRPYSSSNPYHVRRLGPSEPGRRCPEDTTRPRCTSGLGFGLNPVRSSAGAPGAPVPGGYPRALSSQRLPGDEAPVPVALSNHARLSDTESSV